MPAWLARPETWADLLRLTYAGMVVVLLLWRVVNIVLKLAHRDDALNHSRDAFFRYTSYLRF